MPAKLRSEMKRARRAAIASRGITDLTWEERPPEGAAILKLGPGLPSQPWLPPVIHVAPSRTAAVEYPAAGAAPAAGTTSENRAIENVKETDDEMWEDSKEDIEDLLKRDSESRA